MKDESGCVGADPMTHNPDPRKVEVLKVWYSVFCTLMDGNESDAELLKKLRCLRERLMQAYPQLERELKESRV
jgi:hypothetical protein